MSPRRDGHRHVQPAPGSHGQDHRPGVWRVLGWISVVMTAVLVAGSLTAYATYRKLYGNISHDDVTGKLGKRPPKRNKSTNILVIGSDSRAGKNARIGGHDTGQRSDTLILMHMSPDGKHAVGISFPRDSMVHIPTCKAKDGATIPGRTDMINSSFDYGPACTWKTIESLTGIRIDHFVTVDFTGFEGMISALGGVQVCLPQSVNDPDSHLRLSAGKHVVTGKTALAYVRTRHGLGDGSDLSRIKRQQLFMAAMVKKVTGGGMLRSPTKLYRFLNAATKSVTTDSGLGVSEMRKLAESAKGMSAGKVKFVTVPWQPYPANPARVEFRQPAAQQLFHSVSNDNVSSSQTAQKSGKQASHKVSPHKVSVRVYNGTSRPGLAAEAGSALKARGFHVVKVGNAPRHGYSTTEVHYGSGGLAGATTVAGALKHGKTVRGGATGATVNLIIGADWSGTKSGGSGGNIPSGIGGYRGSSNICQKT